MAADLDLRVFDIDVFHSRPERTNFPTLSTLELTSDSPRGKAPAIIPQISAKTASANAHRMETFG